MNPDPTINNPQQSADETLSSLATTGQTPYLLTGQFVALARRLFIDPNNIQDPVLKAVNWHPDYKISKMIIEPVYKWNSTDLNIGQRPAILVKRNGFRRTKLAINDAYSGHSAPPSGEKYECLLTGSHTYFVICGQPAEVEAVANELYTDLLQFAPLIRRDLCLHQFEVMDIGSIAILEEDKQKFVIPIVVTTTHSTSWTVNLEAPFLKTVNLNYE